MNFRPIFEEIYKIIHKASIEKGEVCALKINEFLCQFFEKLQKPKAY